MVFLDISMDEFLIFRTNFNKFNHKYKREKQSVHSSSSQKARVSTGETRNDEKRALNVQHSDNATDKKTRQQEKLNWPSSTLHKTNQVYVCLAE